MGKANYGHVKERWSWVGIRPGLCLGKVAWQSQVKRGGKRDGRKIGGLEPEPRPAFAVAMARRAEGMDLVNLGDVREQVS